MKTLVLVLSVGIPAVGVLVFVVGAAALLFGRGDRTPPPEPKIDDAISRALAGHLESVDAKKASGRIRYWGPRMGGLWTIESVAGIPGALGKIQVQVQAGPDTTVELREGRARGDGWERLPEALQTRLIELSSNRQWSRLTLTKRQISLEPHLVENTSAGRVSGLLAAAVELLDSARDAWEGQVLTPVVEEPELPLAAWVKLDPTNQAELLGPLFDALVERLGLERVSTTLAPDHDDHSSVLRGRVSDRPVRLVVDQWGGVEVELRGGPDVYLALTRDPNLAPRSIDARNEWAEDEDATARIFLSKHVSIEGRPDDLERQRNALGSLPETVVADAIASMEPLDLRYLRISTKTWMSPWGSVQQMEDPEGTLAAMVQLGDRMHGDSGGVVSHPVSQLACTYCGARYFFSAMTPRCPGCGAPPEGPPDEG